jgi:hypothetical protein
MEFAAQGGSVGDEPHGGGRASRGGVQARGLHAIGSHRGPTLAPKPFQPLPPHPTQPVVSPLTTLQR